VKQVPLGSSADQVKALIKRQKWRLMAEWHGKPGNVSSDVYEPKVKDYPAVLGEYFVHADLGYDGIPSISVSTRTGHSIRQEDC